MMRVANSSDRQTRVLWFLLAVLGTVLALVGWSRWASAQVTATLDLTGKWAVEGIFDDTTLSGGGFDCAFKQNGEQLTGTCSDDPSQLTGEVKGQNVSWTLKAVTYTGTVNETGTSITGRFTVADKGGRFTALKSK